MSASTYQMEPADDTQQTKTVSEGLAESAAEPMVKIHWALPFPASSDQLEDIKPIISSQLS